MDFGDAIRALKDGKRVARVGWNGKGMHLVLVRALPLNRDGMWYRVLGKDSIDPAPRNGPRLLPWIGMKTADDCFVPWLASQTDMLAEDWEVVA